MAPKSHKNLIALAVCSMGVFAALWPGAAAAEARPAKTGMTLQYKLKLLHKQERKSISTIDFYRSRDRGRWTLALRHDKCWQVHGKQRRKVCRKARESLRTHTASLAHARARIEKLTAPRDTGYLPPDQARELGRRMAAYFYGWTGNQFDCLDSLWGDNESSWYVYADNPGSTAYGIPQATPGSKMASMGANWRTSAYVQIRWGLNYIRNDDDFSSPCEALAFRIAKGWY